MKITVTFLIVAVSCYFNFASANCMSRCAKSCWQPHVTDLNCLQSALAKSPLATVGAMAHFLCAYDRCKAMKNKIELVRALRNLKEVTQCALENILGNDFTMEELNADVDSIVQYLLRIVVDLLNGLNIESLTTPFCGPLRPLLTKVTRILYILGVPSLDGQIRTVAVINGGKQLLGTVAVRSPGLLPQLLELLLGPKSTLGDVTGLLGGVTEGIVKTVGGLTSGVGGVTGLLGGATGGISKTVGGLTSGDGGVTGLLGGATGGIGKTVGGLTSGVGGVTGLLGGETGGIGKTVGGLTSGVGGVTGLLGGATGGIGKTVGGLTSGVGGVTGLLGGETGGIGKTVGGLTSGLGGVTGLLGATGGIGKNVGGLSSVVDSVTGLVGDVTGLLGGLGKTVGELTSGLGGATDVFGKGNDRSTAGITSGLQGVTETVDSVPGGFGNTFGELTSTLGDANSGLGGVAGILSVVPKANTIDSVAGGLVSPTGVLSGTGLLGGFTGTKKTESLVNDNIFGNSGLATDLNGGGELSVGIGGRFFARPEFRQGNSVLTAQQNADTSGGLFADASGGLQGGLFSGSPTRKSFLPFRK